MLTDSQKKLIDRWHHGLEKRDVEDLVQLFAPHPRIRNAADPPLEGPDAPRRLLTAFMEHIQACRFTLLDAASGEGQLFAGSRFELTLPAGLQIADMKLPRPITVNMRAFERFRLDAQGRIEQLDIVHETTSVFQAAQAAVQERR